MSAWRHSMFSTKNARAASGSPAAVVVVVACSRERPRPPLETMPIHRLALVNGGTNMLRSIRNARFPEQFGFKFSSCHASTACAYGCDVITVLAIKLAARHQRFDFRLAEPENEGAGVAGRFRIWVRPRNSCCFIAACDVFDPLNRCLPRGFPNEFLGKTWSIDYQLST